MSDSSQKPINPTQGTISVNSPPSPPIPPSAPPSAKPAVPQFQPNLPPPPPPPTTPPASAARVQKSPFRFLIPVLAAGIVLLIVVMMVQKFLSNRNNAADSQDPGQITAITYWGLWEPTLIMQDTISKFESQNPDIKVNYQQQSVKEYRERLQNALKSGQGPDLFRFHMSWTPVLTSDLTPIPTEVISASEFENQQYPVAQAWLKSSKGYLGLPLMYEGLGLFYNQEVFESAGAVPPKTWNELRTLAAKLTIPDNRSGTLQVGGIAMGNTTNVDNWSDILGLLLLQNSANPAKPNNKLGQDALTFYTLFTKPGNSAEKIWDESLPTSTIAFASGKAAMIIAPSWRAHEIREMNPNLKFGIAPVPQLPDTQVSWASIWVEGVSSHTDKAKQQAAWKFLSFMNQKDTLREWFAAASKQRLFGEIFARKDMSDQLQTDPMVGAFVTQAPYAQSWFLNSRTFDNGPNERTIKYYEDAINAMLTQGDAAADALPTVEQGVAQVVSQYKLPQNVPQTK